VKKKMVELYVILEKIFTILTLPYRHTGVNESGDVSSSKIVRNFKELFLQLCWACENGTEISDYFDWVLLQILKQFFICGKLNFFDILADQFHLF
jgi:hypothetical protein